MIYTVQLTPQELDLIGVALSKLPLEVALPLYTKLQADAKMQNEAAARRAQVVQSEDNPPAAVRFPG